MQDQLVPLAHWLVILPIVLLLAGAALLLMLGDRARFPRFGAMIIALAVGVSDAFLLQRVLADGPVSMTMGRWLPPFGISFTADAASAAFALLAAFITLIVLACGQLDLSPGGAPSRFYALVLLLLAGVSGAFLTGDLFNLYVWFEVMLIASFGLLVFSGTALTIDATVKYGLVNFVATSLFLLALGLLYGALGTLNMADIVDSAGRADPVVVTAIAGLLLVAFGTKAAAFPVNAWLAASYHAPPPAVSALLGGLLTKVGVYALLRTLALLLPAGRDDLQPVLAVVAAATLLLAPLGALAETNLRRTIGYLLIGGIGAAIAGIALPNPAGLAGAVAYIASSMLAISALYLVAGLIERRTGTTDTRQMGGLYTTSSPLSMAFLLLVVGVAGVPPFLGFWPKLLLVQAAVEQSAAGANPLALPLAFCLLLNALLTLLVGARLWSHIFWRPAQAAPAPIPAIPASLGAVAFLTAIVVVGGLWPEPLLAFARAAAAGLNDPRAYIAAFGLGASP